MTDSTGESDPEALAERYFELLSAYESSNRLSLLYQAAEPLRTAVALPMPAPERLMYQHLLTFLLVALVGETGDQAVLEEAVQVALQADADTPKGHEDRADILSALSAILLMWSERTGDLEVLKESVSTSQQAVAIGRDTPNHAIHLSRLASALGALAKRTGDQDAQREPTQLMQQAMVDLPEGSFTRIGMESNLAALMATMSAMTGDQAGHQEALRAWQRMMATVPEDYPDGTQLFGNITLAFMVEFQRTGDPATLEAAVQAGRRAAAATPEEHPYRSGVLLRLGYALVALAFHTDNEELFHEARRCFRDAAANPAGATLMRINAYRLLAQFSDEGDEEGLRAAQAAVDLVGALAPGSLTRGDREFQLGSLSDLPGDVAAAALSAGSPEKAVELLERCRGVLAADTLGMRGEDLTRLHAHDARNHTDWARRLEDLRSRLDTPGDPRSGPPPASAAARGADYAAWQQLLDQIRALPGFEGFFRPPSVRTLARQAQNGPIVYITTSAGRCDALILTDSPRPVQVVPLTRLTQAHATACAQRLLRACHSAGSRDLAPARHQSAHQEVLTVLAELWNTVAEPVLTRLGHTTKHRDGEPWPRVWWCPVGVTAFLPLHAAGHHGAPVGPDGNPRTVLDRVVSSYTPTVQALAHARMPRHTAAASRSVLVVPVPDLPRQELPGVETETNAITSVIRDVDVDVEVLRHPIRATVLNALPRHDIAHFSCHGHADPTDPALSHLVLDDHATAPLTIADIAALNLTADLAYLSACETAVTTPQFTDESLHLTAAFHLAGYRHIIGTLWPIDDRAAAELAGAFYQHLTNQGTAPPTTDTAARALHEAVRRLRTAHPDTPVLWAAHTHTGA